ncbi:MAG TPA: hypothetical protein VNX28_10000 [Gemmataceae bacterium]|jgi:hypothetical protein|nr:hypothetical protein [Gemmataceae bacterium]
MNTIENTPAQPQPNAISPLDKSQAAMLATTNDRIKQAKRLLSYLLLEVQDRNDPRFTVEQCDLLEKRFYEIRVALDGE